MLTRSRPSGDRPGAGVLMAFFKGSLGETFRPWFRCLPIVVRSRLRTALQRWPALARHLASGEREPPPGTVRWGSFRRSDTVQPRLGIRSRNAHRPRLYREFLAGHAEDVRGACLEVMNADYTNRFGGDRVSRRDVLDIDPANTAATIVADLGEADSLPAQRFDCVIFTQTLHLVPDMRIALANVWRAFPREASCC